MKSALFLLILAAGSLAQVPPPTTRVPPKGVEIPEADRAELTAGAAKLRAELDGLSDKDLLPDAEIYWKAVDWALRYDEFFDVKQVGIAKGLLQEGAARAASLREGKAPWRQKTGPVVLGYRSHLDRSVQPYALLVPASWHPGDKEGRPLHIWNHGRGNTLSELAFISGGSKKVGEFNSEGMFVLAPYGRFCNATKFAGEVDIDEALDDAAAHFPLNRERLVMSGFSMGGASSWHLGAHWASSFLAVTPGAGFAETAVYTKAFAPGKEPPPWWEQVLWHLYDATDYVRNFSNTALVVYSGEDDPQKQAADMMVAAATQEGLKVEHLIGPKTGHKYEPETKKVLAARLDEIVAKGRPEVPPRVQLVTYTLKYPQQHWVSVVGLEKHWERAEVDAEIVDEGTIRVKTRNVAALCFEMPQTVPLDATRPPRIVIDDQELVGPPVQAHWQAFFRKTRGAWKVTAMASDDEGTLRKRRGLQGPIDDAFMARFIFVRPTGTPLNAAVGAWAQAEFERAVPQWRKVFRGDVRIVDDTAVTPEMINNSNLILWGDPSSNIVLKQIVPKLPITWTAEKVVLGQASGEGANHVPVLVYPNPLNPGKYVVINSSFTFRQGSDTTNALQTPKLPDWALIDLRTPPNEKWPGLVVDAGFFNEQWQFP